MKKTVKTFNKLYLCSEFIFRAFYKIQDTISTVMFVQFLVFGVSICVTLTILIFFADDIVTMIYYALFLLSLPLEIFPCCYYGSTFEYEFGKLLYAAFKCNWIDQDAEFKKNIQIFAARSFKVTTMHAFGILKISIDTFLTTCKSAYSLFAVVLRAK